MGLMNINDLLIWKVLIQNKMDKHNRILDNLQTHVADNVEETRTIEFVASDNTRDAHGTVVPVDKWDLDRFNKNGVIGYMHNLYGDLCNAPDPDDVIGVGRARTENGQLIIAVTFEPADINPKAEKIFRKVLFGSLKAVSVGFSELKRGHYGAGEEAKGQPNETYYFDGQELMELSIVNIPSNKNALKRQIRENATSAIMYIYRALEGKKRLADIENMTVGQVVEMIEGRSTEEPLVSIEITLPETPNEEEDTEEKIEELEKEKEEKEEEIKELESKIEELEKEIEEIEEEIEEIEGTPLDDETEEIITAKAALALNN